MDLNSAEFLLRSHREVEIHPATTHLTLLQHKLVFPSARRNNGASIRMQTCLEVVTTMRMMRMLNNSNMDVLPPWSRVLVQHHRLSATCGREEVMLVYHTGANSMVKIMMSRHPR